MQRNHNASWEIGNMGKALGVAEIMVSSAGNTMVLKAQSVVF